MREDGGGGGSPGEWRAGGVYESWEERAEVGVLQRERNRG